MYFLVIETSTRPSPVAWLQFQSFYHHMCWQNYLGMVMGIYVINRWCNNIKIHTLILLIHPFYLPRPFPTVVIGWVHILSSANIKAVLELLAKGSPSWLNTPRLQCLGEFNNCRPIQPYVHHVSTWKDNILGFYYEYVFDHMEILMLSALRYIGFVDHNIGFLLPHYKSELKLTKSDAIQLVGSLTLTVH